MYWPSLWSFIPNNYFYYTSVIRYCQIIALLGVKIISLFQSIQNISTYNVYIKFENISLHLFAFIHHIVVIFPLDWLFKQACGFLWKFSLGFVVTQCDSISLFYCCIYIWCHSIETKANWCNAIIGVLTQSRFYLSMDYSYLFSF